ncbi:MAG: hypothetical protein ACR2QW_09960 [bacterium]
MYSIDGLVHGIERCKINIAALEGAIADEQKTIADYKIMIAKLEKVEQERIEAESHVEYDNSD